MDKMSVDKMSVDKMYRDKMSVEKTFFGKNVSRRKDMLLDLPHE